MDNYLHVTLVFMLDDSVIIRYSRCGSDLTPQEQQHYFERQVADQYSCGARLLAIVHEPGHNHLPVVVGGELQDRSDKAHMA